MAKGAGTSGGAGGAGGGLPRRRRAALLVGAFALFSLVQLFANAQSTLSDFARAGIRETAAHVWIWQISSLIAWLAVLPLIWLVVRTARPPRLGWPLVALVHLLATVLLSALHVAAMIALRKLAYAVEGGSYDAGRDLLAVFAYEYRKDAVTYLLLAAFAAYAQWLLAPRDAQSEVRPMLVIADGTVTHRVPIAEIEWAAAAGNYVEIAWRQRILLHRSTLAALAEELGQDFARIHRARLVRRDAVRRIDTHRSGDFTVTLADGAELRGSRRYRAGL